MKRIALTEYNSGTTIDSEREDFHPEIAEGETMEMRLERIMNNKDGGLDSSPLLYTKRDDGVIPIYDVRADRMEAAIMAVDSIKRSNIVEAVETARKNKQTEQEAAGKNTSSQQEE